MSSKAPIIRPTTAEDAPAINAIHNYYVDNTVITFITERVPVDDTIANFNKVKSLGLPFVVAENPVSQDVVGFCYVLPFRGVKAGYRHTLELSLFCAPTEVRKGIGGLLLERMIDVIEHPDNWEGYCEGWRLLDTKPRQLLAVMAIDVEGPGKGMKLKEWYVQRGFVERGHLKGIGFKKGRWIDTVYLQRALNVSDDDR